MSQTSDSVNDYGLGNLEMIEKTITALTWMVISTDVFIALATGGGACDH